MKKWIISSLSVLSLSTLACSQEVSSGEFGTLAAHLTVTASAHDVTSVYFKVVSQQTDCTGPAVAEMTIALEGEALPAAVAPIGAGTNHRFSDGLTSLAPGDYTVCITPITVEGTPSSICGPAQANATVTEGATTEVVVASTCDGTGNGALDTIAVLNDPPVVSAIELEQSKFILDCETLDLSASATDVNGDTVTFSYVVMSSPPGSVYQLIQTGDQATFTPDGDGEYAVEIRATDVFGASSSIVVPVHVSESEGGECGPNLSDMPQLYCNGSCGNWGGGDGCQQEDADIYCRLITNNAAATASSFSVTTALDAPGICCPAPTIVPGSLGCEDLGVLSVSGTDLNISVHPTSVLSTHGAGEVIYNAVCSVP